jgi:hypothetical protein
MSVDQKRTVLPSLRDLMRRWTDWRGRRKRVAEIERLGAEGGASIAQDIGTSVGELRALASKWPDSAADLLARRLRAQNLDSATLSATHPAVARDLSRLCSLCEDKPQCLRDLRQRSDSAVWQSYCPNAGTLTALQQERDAALGNPETHPAKHAVPRRN